MNRINAIINLYSTIAAVSFYQTIVLGRDGFIEEAAETTDRMLDARGQLKTWIKISQAIRGWQL